LEELDCKLIILHLTNAIELIMKDLVLDGGSLFIKTQRKPSLKEKSISIQNRTAYSFTASFWDDCFDLRLNHEFATWRRYWRERQKWMPIHVDLTWIAVSFVLNTGWFRQELFLNTW